MSLLSGPLVKLYPTDSAFSDTISETISETSGVTNTAVSNDSTIRATSQSKITCAFLHGHICSEFVWLDNRWDELCLPGAAAPVEIEVRLIPTKTRSALSQPVSCVVGERRRVDRVDGGRLRVNIHITKCMLTILKGHLPSDTRRISSARYGALNVPCTHILPSPPLPLSNESLALVPFRCVKGDVTHDCQSHTALSPKGLLPTKSQP